MDNVYGGYLEGVRMVPVTEVSGEKAEWSVNIHRVCRLPVAFADEV